MAKRINMTRERMVALPTIILAAKWATRHAPMDDKQRANLEQALEKFNEQ